MNYRVAIPTYRRHDVVAHKTLAMLARGGVDPGCVTLLCANEAQRDLYLKAVPRNLYDDIFITEVGVVASRNAYTRAMPDGQRIVWVDDDIERLDRLADDGKSLIEIPCGEVFERGFRLCDKEGLRMWGPYPVANHFFMKRGYTTDFKIIIGGVHGLVNDPTLLGTMDVKDDYERCIKVYLRDGGMVRLSDVTLITRYRGGKGGLNESRTAADDAVSAEKLAALYPDLCQLGYSRTHKTKEVRFRRLPRVERW